MPWDRVQEIMPSHPLLQSVVRRALVVIYAAAGALHLYSTENFLLIVPSFVPFPEKVIQITGVCELAGAIGLLIPRLRRPSGIMFAIYAICVFPANVKHAIEGIDVPNLPTSWWYHGPRLLCQPVLVWAALFCADVVRWPFYQRRCF